MPETEEQGFILAEHSPRKLAVILHADVVGSTALVQRDEALAHERIRDAFRRLSETIEAYGGTTQELRGDALVADFARASDAVSAAIAFQQADTKPHGPLDDDIQPQLRIGISLGEVIIADNTVTGAGVVLAQRLEQLADPGGVCIQGAVHEIVPRRLPFAYESLGGQVVKGFEEEIRAVRVALFDGADIPTPEDTQNAFETTASPDLPRAGASIAVLPFNSLSTDPEQVFFGDGMTEDIITGLSRFPSLCVVARSSTFAYKGQSPDIRTLGRELGVRYVLEGSIRSGGDRIRVTAQLIDAITGNHIWAERYDRSLADIFVVQDNITESIVAKIEPEIGHAERKRSLRKPPENLDAWDLYQRGIAAYYDPARESLVSAIELLDKAGALDGHFAHAFAMAAHARLRLARLSPVVENRDELISRADEQAQMAVVMEPQDPICLVAQGRALTHLGQHETAISRIEQAITLNPNYAFAHFALGASHVAAGRPEDAIERYNNALRLSPNDAYSHVFQLMRAEALLDLQRYQESAQWSQRATESPIVPFWGFAFLAAALAGLDKSKEADAALQEVFQRVPSFSLDTVRRNLAHYSPHTIQHRIELLRKAGVPN